MDKENLQYVRLKYEALSVCFVIFIVLAALFILLQLIIVNFFVAKNSLIETLHYIEPLGALVVCFFSVVLTVKFGIDCLVIYFQTLRKKNSNEIQTVLTNDILRQSFFHRKGLG
ncbi:MAG: hypothetical protein SV583_06690 [Pseudomonadota bacterium]|nr:hypothetical protein [Pseudomonadota bacterium]